MVKERKGSSKKVMVAIDESDLNYNALIWVLDNLEESVKDTFLVIFATQPLTNFSYPLPASLGFARFYFPLLPTGDLIKQNQRRTRKVSPGLLEKAKSICASCGVNAKTFTEAGDPKEAICNAVQVHNVNLLVVGDTDKSSGIIKRLA
ncbi:Universal stress protein [Parasponia andersonii]|uniref:Universal stress protein n=1 Tax=Parasponia andersonii TaxID=3476 RepID=A0A2P5DZB6_PARAD|nr:Universal stress protein [Parasponia andersonii]